MGREIKRVALDFQWPLNKAWKGFLNPHPGSDNCVECGGTGSSPEARALHDMWYGNAPFNPSFRDSESFMPDTPAIHELARRNVERSPEYYGEGEDAVAREARRLCRHFNSQWAHHLNQLDVDALLAKDRLWDFTRVPRTPEQEEIVKAKVAAGGNSWLPEDNGYRPTAAEVNLWSLRGFGHDSINAWICVNAECRRLGHDPVCHKCEGHGSIWASKEAEDLYNSWKPEEPPAGEGYQLWETVSEGSPVSPVFATPEELADWLVAPGNDNSVTAGTTRDQWLRMINGPGWAPSFIGSSAGTVPGVQM